MESNDLKCKNCGADLELESANTLRCPYCGSKFPVVLKDNFVPPPPVQKQGEPALSSPPIDSEPYKPANSGVGCFALVALAVLILIVYLVAANHSADSSSAYADSTTTDTTGLSRNDNDTTQTDIEKESNESSNKSTADDLSNIKITVAEFKELYKNARKETDRFSGDIMVADKTSPSDFDPDGIFATIVRGKKSSIEIHLKILYTTRQSLIINKTIFYTDNKPTDYFTIFNVSEQSDAEWEHSDEKIDTHDLTLLVKLATAKKASVKFIGDKYYKIIDITPAQQAALKRQLQLYKGLLLQYERQ